MADDKKRWFDWLPWRGREPEPDIVSEPMTVLGMEPLVALLILIGILSAGLVLYYNPRQSWRGFARMMGEISAAVIATVIGVVVVVGGAAVYLEAAGLLVILIFAVIGVIAVVAFFASGGL